jgi:hypothetical protein
MIGPYFDAQRPLCPALLLSFKVIQRAGYPMPALLKGMGIDHVGTKKGVHRLILRGQGNIGVNRKMGQECLDLFFAIGKIIARFHLVEVHEFVNPLASIVHGSGTMRLLL